MARLSWEEGIAYLKEKKMREGGKVNDQSH